MTKRQLQFELSEVSVRIKQIIEGNEVVKERYDRWGITLQDLMLERLELVKKYDKRWGYLHKKKEVIY